MNEEQIKKEFYDFSNPTREGFKPSDDLDQFYPKRYNKEIADWWLLQFSSYKEGLIKEMEGMKKEGLKNSYFCDECGGFDDCDCEGYNAALDDIITLIKK